jgi:hypothetical protein
MAAAEASFRIWMDSMSPGPIRSSCIKVVMASSADWAGEPTDHSGAVA